MLASLADAGAETLATGNRCSLSPSRPKGALKTMQTGTFFQYPSEPAQRAEPAMSLLPKAGKEDWERLLAHTSARRFVAGEWLMHEGDRDDALYFLAEGDLEVLLPTGRNGATRQLAVIRAGSVVGEQAFLDRQPRSTHIRALSNGEVYRLSREAFLVFSAREPALARELLMDMGRIVSLRLRETTRLLAKNSR